MEVCLYIKGGSEIKTSYESNCEDNLIRTVKRIANNIRVPNKVKWMNIPNGTILKSELIGFSAGNIKEVKQ